MGQEIATRPVQAEDQPTKPCLPERLKSLLDTCQTVEIGDDGSADLSAWVPPLIDSKQKAWVSTNVIPDFDAFLAPAPGVDLTARITTLLSHFFVAKMPAAAWSQMIEDWRKALSDLPMWAINGACERWLQDEERKPTPAGIRRMANDLVAEAKTEREKLLSMVALPSPANRLSASMHGKLAPAIIAKWIDGLSVDLVDGGAVVRCPSAYHRTWVDSRYAAEIKEVLAVKRVWFLLAGEAIPRRQEINASAKPMPGTTKRADGRTSEWEGLSDNDIPRLRE